MTRVYAEGEQPEKKEEGVKVTLSLNNEMLAQMISKGIQDLPKEVIHTLSYEAMKTALEDKEFLKHLMFRADSDSYNWWDRAHLQPWLAELLSKSFTEEEVKDFRDGVLNVLKADHRSIAVDAITNCFMHRLAHYDFTSEVQCIIGQMLNRNGQ